MKNNEIKNTDIVYYFFIELPINMLVEIINIKDYLIFILKILTKIIKITFIGLQCFAIAFIEIVKYIFFKAMNKAMNTISGTVFEIPLINTFIIAVVI